MKKQFFLLFTLLFLFYPGDSYYFNIFANNKNLFQKSNPIIPEPSIKPIPYIKTNLTPNISAEGVYIVDLPSFTPLYEKNAHTRFIPASTNKIITALVAYDIYTPEDVITVQNPISTGQIMGLVNQEKITVENLLYGTLVQSGNDAAQALADNYGTDLFVQLMNEKAKALGMKDTHFTNPTGLDDFTQYTTPFDLALAGRELLKNKLLKKIVSTKEIIISDVDFKEFHTLSNVNKLLGEIQGIGGLKTGYTENAKENLVSFYKRNGFEYLIVILKSDDRFSDTKELVSWIIENTTHL
jgi:D-alanyl-D-alanine carboxypeptidase